MSEFICGSTAQWESRLSGFSMLKVVQLFMREDKTQKTCCAGVSLMSHKIGTTWPIDAKNALFNAESKVSYVCKLSESYLLTIQIGRPRNSAHFFRWGGGQQLYDR